MLQLLKYGNLYDITLSRCPVHSFATCYCNKRPCMVLLLNGACSQPWFISTMSRFSAGGPLAAKQTIHGSHSWSRGTINSNTICHRWSRGISCGRGPLAVWQIHWHKTANIWLGHQKGTKLAQNAPYHKIVNISSVYNFYFLRISFKILPIKLFIGSKVSLHWLQ